MNMSFTMFESMPTTSFLLMHHVNSVIVTPSVQWLPVLFRTMALLIAAPIVFLTSLDVAAYLIARTLGAPHHRHVVKAHGITHEGDGHRTPTIIISPPCIEPCSLALSSAISSALQLPTPPADEKHQYTHFTSHSDGNFALSGEGVFSPPESRASSPPLDRKHGYKTRKRAASIGVEALGAITDSETESNGSSASSSASSSIGSVLSNGLPPTPAASMRRRNPGLQLTPMKA